MKCCKPSGQKDARARLDEVVARMGMGTDFVQQFNATNKKRMDEGY